MGRVAATAFAEARGADSVARADVSAQFTPLPFLSFIGSAGRTSDDRLPGTTISTNYARGEAGIRVHQRKCPVCDGGKPGLPVPAEEPSLFG